MGTDKPEVNVNLTENNKPRFTIQSNILTGPVVPRRSTYTSFGQILFDTLRNNPSVIGQVDAITDERTSFADMLDRSIKCALWMKKQGVQPGDVIGLSTDNHLNSCIPCIACCFIGAVFNPWDYASDNNACSYFLSLSEAKIVFANKEAANVLSKVIRHENLSVKMVVFGQHSAAIPFSQVLQGHQEAEVKNFKCTEIKNISDTALILYSSGTTGLSKGVQLSHDTLIQNCEIPKALTLAGCKPLWFSSLSWITGIMLTFSCITNHIAIIQYPKFEEETTCKLIQKYKVTWLFLGTSMANRLVKSGYLSKYDLSSLQVLFTGGASLNKESQQEMKKRLPNVTVFQAYGMTEAGCLITAQTPNSPDGSVGVVAENVQLKIIDPNTGVILPAQQHGEICLKASTQTTGYWKNPEATKNTIDQEGWLHTGDLGYFDENGEVFIVDRLKELIKFKGYHVTPGLIESILQTHPAVQEVAVVAVPHPTDDEHPIAFVSQVPGEKVTAQELIDLVAANAMDSHRLRGGVRFLPSLPHNASGKISRKAIKELAKTDARTC